MLQLGFNSLPPLPRTCPSLYILLVLIELPATMISDSDLYRLAIFLGSCSMMMVVLYHFLEVNARDDSDAEAPAANNKVAGNGQSGATAQAATAGSAIGGGKGR